VRLAHRNPCCSTQQSALAQRRSREVKLPDPGRAPARPPQSPRCTPRLPPAAERVELSHAVRTVGAPHARAHSSHLGSQFRALLAGSACCADLDCDARRSLEHPCNRPNPLCTPAAAAFIHDLDQMMRIRALQSALAALNGSAAPGQGAALRTRPERQPPSAPQRRSSDGPGGQDSRARPRPIRASASIRSRWPCARTRRIWRYRWRGWSKASC